MLSLTKELQRTYEYKGHEYHINFAFDNILRWYEMIEDDAMSEEEKVILAFEMLFPGVETEDADLIVGGVQSVADYIQASPYGNGANDPDTGFSTPDRYYSFTQDAEAIYASFMSQYGIDLVEQQGKLHWDKFKALFSGLEEHTAFKEIVSIRTRDTSQMEGKELNEFKSIQNFYALNDDRSVEHDNQAMNDAFTALKAWATS
ncbi:bacteriophage Gp15 family protein [Ligilactobacillus acidipiscis]|uniref:bacteriophage Gp15 family protein n=1 Tax=Ligilactobacillus acidipiscis TaxID=89059 RepID=UPI0023F96016|nr:bacteriophage Gp15 family protein [Ligilactobacillus acidipiscis]WEV56128.1 bacteriophage Gp15 family protein [Ligilactobacillus acidipiscis]